MPDTEKRRPSLGELVTNNYVWRSIFRHGMPDTSRNRVLVVMSNGALSAASSEPEASVSAVAVAVCVTPGERDRATKAETAEIEEVAHEGAARVLALARVQRVIGVLGRAEKPVVGQVPRPRGAEG